MATMTLDVRIPARCWIAPEMPTATYSVGLTVFPVWPTWSAWGRHPASTTARDAPTAALPPNAAASASSTLKFAGSLSPRPPDTTIGASATSRAPASAALIWRTITRPAATSSAAVSTVPALGRCTGVNTLGRSEMRAGRAVSFTLSNAFPAYTGRITVTVPSSTATSVTSCASGTPSRAATRGARSFPVAPAANTTAPYPPALTRAAIACAYPSGAYIPNAALVSVITWSAPKPPSWSVPRTGPAPRTSASTLPPSASAMRRAPVTTSWETLRNAPSRCSSTARTRLTEPSPPPAAAAPALAPPPRPRPRSFPPSAPPAARDLEVRDRGDARQAEQLRRQGTDLMVVVVDRHLAEQDQVVVAVLELSGEGLGDREAVGGDLVDLQQHAAVGAHRERGPDRFLGGPGPERDDHDFASPGLLLAPQGLLDRELVVRIENKLDARL